MFLCFLLFLSFRTGSAFYVFLFFCFFVFLDVGILCFFVSMFFLFYVAGQALASVRSIKNNPNLRPENTRNLEAGLEFKFLRDRVGLDLSVYRSNTYDQIIPVTVTGATGFLQTYKNAGEIQNQGVEISLNATPIRNKNFSWDIGFNWSKNQNEVVKLFDDQTNLQLSS